MFYPSHKWRSDQEMEGTLEKNNLGSRPQRGTWFFMWFLSLFLALNVTKLLGITWELKTIQMNSKNTTMLRYIQGKSGWRTHTAQAQAKRKASKLKSIPRGEPRWVTIPDSVNEKNWEWDKPKGDKPKVMFLSTSNVGFVSAAQLHTKFTNKKQTQVRS